MLRRTTVVLLLFQYMETVGSVHRITDKGDVRVQFDGCSNRWTFFAGALTKVGKNFNPRNYLE